MRRFLPALVMVAVLAAGCAEPEAKKDDQPKKEDDTPKEAYDPPYPRDDKDPVVVMKVKDFGDVKIELFQKKAPITVKNFLRYVDEGHYDGTIFHRVMPDFMIQGGHFTKGFAKARSHPEAETLSKTTHGNIKNEASNGLANKRGTLAMARLGEPDTASDQFFVNVVDNGKLDPGGVSEDGYAVFGQVIDGMHVVDRIKRVKALRRSPAGHEAVPVEDVIIESIRREEKSK